LVPSRAWHFLAYALAASDAHPCEWSPSFNIQRHLFLLHGASSECPIQVKVAVSVPWKSVVPKLGDLGTGSSPDIYKQQGLKPVALPLEMSVYSTAKRHGGIKYVTEPGPY
jgi:hypothetical protein